MEFLPYAEAIRALAHHGIVARPEGDFIRFSLQPPAPSRTAHNGEVHHIAIAAAGRAGAPPAADRVVTVSADRLSKAPEVILHRAHATEFQLIPAGLWRGLLDLLAFDLAGNEDWLDVDADASLHQNGRDPLGLLSRQRHLVGVIAAVIFKSAGGPEHDLTIVALDAPLVIELRHDGVIVMSCVGKVLAESLVSAL